jgi:hypothetical protein
MTTLANMNDRIAGGSAHARYDRRAARHAENLRRRRPRIPRPRPRRRRDRLDRAGGGQPIVLARGAWPGRRTIHGMAEPGELDAYKLVYDEAVRAIEGQRAAVDEIRTRSGILLSATSIITGFLGPAALQPGSPLLIAFIAAALLLLSVVPVIFVLLPTQGWAFSLGTKLLLGGYVETDPPASMKETYRSLAWFLEVDWEANKDMLVVRYRLFTLAAVALVGETMVWLLAIAIR